MDELPREITTVKPGDPHRAQIVQEIIRISDASRKAVGNGFGDL